jgi:hypothetical protein
LGSHRLAGPWTNYALGEISGNKLTKFAYGKLKEKTLNTTETSDEFNVPRRAGMTFIATFVLGNATEPKPLDTFIRFDGWKKVISIYWADLHIVSKRVILLYCFRS